MKRILLIFLIIAGTITAQAQDGKATKEQTIEYILNSLKGKTFESESGFVTTINEINFSNCEMHIKLSESWSNGGLSDNTFKLTDIESVSLSNITSHNTNKVNGKSIVFKVFNKKNLIQKIIKYKGEEPRTANDYYLSFQIPDDQKLVDAFNHLRKLCGAPEPIKF